MRGKDTNMGEKEMRRKEKRKLKANGRLNDN